MSVGEPTQEEIVQAYVSTLYPTRYSGTGYLYHAQIVHQMLRGITVCDRILDVGCGTGFVNRCAPLLDILGVDLSPQMLAQHPGPHLQAPAEDLPFEAATFDVVLCRSLLHHLEVPALGLTEMARVLKPGGRWVCWEPNLSIFNDWVRWLARKTRRFSHWHKNFEPRELRALIRGAGLTITSVQYQGYVAYPLIGFPDILNLHVPQWVGRGLLAVDAGLSRTPLAPLGWAVMIRAVK